MKYFAYIIIHKYFYVTTFIFTLLYYIYNHIILLCILYMRVNIFIKTRVVPYFMS